MSAPPAASDGEELADGDGGHWYATRVQTILVVGKSDPKKDGVRVTMWERDAFVLKEDGRPEWSGAVRKFQLVV